MPPTPRPAPDPPFSVRPYAGPLGLAAAVTVILHAHAFFLPRAENDEKVYLYLAGHMGWDTSRYTTAENADFREFPWSIYRQPLFHQPPLYPLVLKAGGALTGGPADAGLLFNLGSVFLLLYYCCRATALLGLSPGWAAVPLAGVTFCPLLLSSTVLIHLDGLLGVYLACAVVAFLEMLDRPTAGRAAVAAGFLAVALNLRYNALIALPVFPFLAWYRLGRPGPVDRAAVWRHCGAVAAVVATVGLQHYYRIFAEYGTIWPGSFVRLTGENEKFSEYVRQITTQTRVKTAVFLVMTYPVLLAALDPRVYGPLAVGWRVRAWGPAVLAAFAYLMMAQLALSYDQLRYFAAEMPLLYLGLAYLLANLGGGSRGLLAGLCVVSLVFMVTAGFEKTRIRPPGTMGVVPPPFYYFPPLVPYYP